jgi:hypothetical protein
MKYETRLPSLRLKLEDLKDLENIILNSISVSGKHAEQKIEIKYDGWTKSYDSVKKLIKDPLKPTEIRNFAWSFKCSEGMLIIRCLENFGFLEIYGKDKWVKILQIDLNQFISKHKSFVGNLTNNQVFLTILYLFGVFSLLFSILPSKNLETPKGLFLFLLGWVFVFFSILQLSEEHKLIPFFCIEFKKDTKRKTIEQIILNIILGLVSSLLFFLLSNVLLR